MYFSCAFAASCVWIEFASPNSGCGKGFTWSCSSAYMLFRSETWARARVCWNSETRCARAYQLPLSPHEILCWVPSFWLQPKVAVHLYFDYRQWESERVLVLLNHFADQTNRWSLPSGHYQLLTKKKCVSEWSNDRWNSFCRRPVWTESCPSHGLASLSSVMSQSWSIPEFVPETDVFALDSRCCIFLLIRTWKCEIRMTRDKTKLLSCFAIRFQRLQKQQHLHQKTQRGTAQGTTVMGDWRQIERMRDFMTGTGQKKELDTKTICTWFWLQWRYLPEIR